MTPHYQSPDISGHESAIKDVLIRFLAHASQEPYFDATLAVHAATVYVMQHLPPGVARVDGYIIEPLLKQVVAEFTPNVAVTPDPAPQVAPEAVESAPAASAPAATGVVASLFKRLKKLFK